MKDEFLAKDCLQESLIQVIRKIDMYEERGLFRAWIGSVTVKKCLDEIRKEKRHMSSDLDGAPDPSYDENVSYKLEKDDVMRFLDTLPDSYRIAINMFLVEGYSHKEIGERLGVTESSSRSLVSRARSMIAQAFKQEHTKVSMIAKDGRKTGSLKIKMI